MGRRGLSAATPRRSAALALAGLAGLLTGCAGRTPAPRIISVAPPGGFTTRGYSTLGLRLSIPRNWTSTAARQPLVGLFTSGPAVISLWRYPQAGGTPRSPGQLKQALSRLTAAARTRDHTLRVLRSLTGSVAGQPAVEIETVQRMGSAVRQVYSTHVYGGGQEVVLEEYAPVSQFSAVDRTVFRAVRRSLAPLPR